jgi:hypothetical protein
MHNGKVTLDFWDSGSNATASTKSNTYDYYIDISHPSDDTFSVSSNKITQITIEGQNVQIIADGKNNEIKRINGKWVNTRLANQQTKAPIPPLAIILSIIAIPIVLRKYI